jgi:hypothetical protein
MGQLAIYHAKCILQAYRAKETFKFCCFQIPDYLKASQERISLLQCISLVAMQPACILSAFLDTVVDTTKPLRYYGHSSS